MHAPPLTSYLARWEEAYLRGKDLSPEQLCPDRPDLIPRLAPLVAALRTTVQGMPAAGSPPGAATEPPDLLADTTPPDRSAMAGHPTTPPLPAGTGASPLPTGYEILGELGRGGMGVVYKARQVGLNRVCALKMVLAGEHSGEAERARFRTEAEAVARLQHPNIVQVFEVGSHHGHPFFSLEFCPGGSLDQRLKGTPLEPQQAAQLVQPLAAAVHAAHRANVVHRDLKPANVLLAADGTPKVTDFGLAKKLDEAGQTQTGTILGTPSYMAPEQAAGSKGVGPAADVYALGAILYECLTGRPPFRAATVMDTLAQVMADEPVPPRRLNSKVPRALEAVTLTCLAKDPCDRYASADELASDLGRWLNGEPTKAAPPGWGRRLVRWGDERPILAVGAVVVLCAPLLLLATNPPLLAGLVLALSLAGLTFGGRVTVASSLALLLALLALVVGRSWPLPPERELVLAAVLVACYLIGVSRLAVAFRGGRVIWALLASTLGIPLGLAVGMFTGIVIRAGIVTLFSVPGERAAVVFDDAYRAYLGLLTVGGSMVGAWVGARRPRPAPRR